MDKSVQKKNWPRVLTTPRSVELCVRPNASRERRGDARRGGEQSHRAVTPSRNGTTVAAAKTVTTAPRDVQPHRVVREKRGNNEKRR